MYVFVTQLGKITINVRNHQNIALNPCISYVNICQIIIIIIVVVVVVVVVDVVAFIVVVKNNNMMIMMMIIISSQSFIRVIY